MGNGLAKSIKKICSSGDSWFAIIMAIIFICALAFGIDCLIVWFCMFLWNSCLVAAIPAVSAVGYWQMYGLYLLFHILFKATVNTTTKSDNE